MDVKPVGGKCCSFMNMKTGCFLTAYFLLVFQSIAVAKAFYLWIAKESALKILEENKMNSWNSAPVILSIGLAIVLTISTICFMVELFIGLDEIFELIIVAQAVYLWITKESVLKILEEEKIFFNFFLLFQCIGLILVETIATIPLIVVLLVGLHKSTTDTRLIKIFFMSSPIMLTVSFLCYFNLLSK